MDAIALSLAAAIAWGAADFWGGLTTRRAPVLGVTIVSQACGLLGILVLWGVRGGGVDTRSLWLGAIAGVGGGLGLAALYEALASGTMSIVSPVVASGAVVPFAISLGTGERPSAAALAGAAAALAGAVLASTQESRGATAGGRRAIALAAAAAVTLGLFVYFLGLAAHGSTLSALLGARLTSLPALAALALVTQRPLRLPHQVLPAVAAVGVLDIGANGLFALASGRGLLAIVSVIAALFPVTTVVLAHTILRERITRLQRLGVGVALVGIALVSAF